MEKVKAAFDLAWDALKLEINLYWKRATYFAAILFPIYIGIFSIFSNEKYPFPDSGKHSEIFLLICFGFIISLGWYFVNKGSKYWQRNWELQIEILEDYVTGPVRKTVFTDITFSVSKINEIISIAVCCLGYYWE